jgi:hypothetical protein
VSTLLRHTVHAQCVLWVLNCYDKPGLRQRHWSYRSLLRCPVLNVSSLHLQVTEESFPKGIIVDIADCGHNVPSEKFEDLVKELLTFHRDVTDTLK